jgi:hypothetical protein
LLVRRGARQAPAVEYDDDTGGRPAGERRQGKPLAMGGAGRDEPKAGIDFYSAVNLTGDGWRCGEEKQTEERSHATISISSLRPWCNETRGVSYWQ